MSLTGVIDLAGKAASPVGAITGAVSAIVGLFGGKKDNKVIDPNVWRDHDQRFPQFGAGYGPARWSIMDGEGWSNDMKQQATANELHNIYMYVRNVPNGLNNILRYHPQLGKTITIEDLINKASRVGDKQIADYFISLKNRNINASAVLEPEKASNKIFIYVGFAFLVLILFGKKLRSMFRK